MANGIRALGYLTEASITTEVEQVLIDALANRSPKICWNSCLAIAKFVQTKQGSRLNSPETSLILFDILSSRPNLKTRIQAVGALNAYENIHQMGGEEALAKAWESLTECVAFHNQFMVQSSASNEQKYVE